MKHGSEMAVERAEQPEIDFVILWVDGNDPEHRRKRQRYLCEFQSESEHNAEQSTDDKRFVQHDELKFCLRSIKQFAPWYRKIHLVTDGQIPTILKKGELEKDRIVIVDHSELFKGNERYLPTFNSRALASTVHHIPGLSEYYLLGNDDVMLSAPIKPNFFFIGEKPVIYADRRTETNKAPMTLWRLGVIAGAEMQGYDSRYYLVPSHGFLPFVKRHMRELEQSYTEQFNNNLQHKFRHESQFVVESLYNHYCLRTGKGVLKDTTPMVHFSFELCREGTLEKILFLFELLRSGKRKMFCINEYQSMLIRYPQITQSLSAICGPPLRCEQVVSGAFSHV